MQEPAPLRRVRVLEGHVVPTPSTTFPDPRADYLLLDELLSPEEVDIRLKVRKWMVDEVRESSTPSLKRRPSSHT
jgi:hypothetical protein